MSTFPRDDANRLVEALYAALLGRTGDADGVAEKASRLAEGAASLERIATEMVGSEEFGLKLPELLARRPPGARLRFTNDHSQYGETWLLMREWVNRQALCGVVVDVGARGRERSNSYDLMRHFGWRGVLVEANPALLAAIERDFHGTDLRLISCAVSDYEGRASFTLGVNDDVSSLDAGLAANWGDTQGQVEVEVRRLPEVLAEAAVPERFDLLSLDIEGEDIRVLNDLIGRSAYRPEWVIIEASDDFRIGTLEDAPFSDRVRAAYAVRMATSANLILRHRHPEREAWREACAERQARTGP